MFEQKCVQALMDTGLLFVGDGYRAKNEELGKFGFPFARAGNINNGFHFSDADCIPVEEISKVGNKLSKFGDVVFTSKGTVGRFAYVSASVPPFVYSPQLCFWRSLNTEAIRSDYLYYWMSSRAFFEQFNSVKGQTDMADYVSLTDQRRMTVDIPPIEIQDYIVTHLKPLDDKIELNRKMNETLEAMARAIFKSWFVDFDPVRAKQQGNKPFGMDDETAALFPSEFEDSELGPIPKGWKVVELRDVIDLHYGKSLTNDLRVEGTILVFGSKGKIGTHNVSIASGPGIIVGRKGWPGAVVFSDRDFFAIDTTFFVGRKSRLPWLFIFFMLQSLKLENLGGDSAVPGLSRDIALRQTLVIPTSDLLVEKFDQLVAPLRTLFFSNENECETLAQTRDLLLPKLLSGEIDLK